MVNFKQKYVFKDSKKAISREQEIKQSKDDNIFTFGDGNRVLYTVNAKSNELIIENKEEFLSSLKALAFTDNATNGMKSLYESALERSKNDNENLVLPIDNVKMDLKLGLTLDMKDATGIAKKFKINGVGLQVMPNGENSFTSLDMQTRTNFFMTDTTVPKNIVDLINTDSLSFGPSIGIELFDSIVKDQNNNVNKFSTDYKAYGTDNCKIFQENRDKFSKTRKIDLMKIGNYIYVPSGSSAIAIPVTEKNVRIVKIDNNNYMFKFVPDNKLNPHGNICLAGLNLTNLKNIMKFVFADKIKKGEVFKYDFESLDEKEEYLEPNTKSKNVTTIRVDNVDEIFKPSIKIKINDKNSTNNVIVEEKNNEKDKNAMDLGLTAPNGDKNNVMENKTHNEFEIKSVEYPLTVSQTLTNNNEDEIVKQNPEEENSTTGDDNNQGEDNSEFNINNDDTTEVSSDTDEPAEEKETKDEFEIEEEKPKEPKNDEIKELKEKIIKLEKENEELKKQADKLENKNKASIISNAFLYFGALILFTLAFFTGNVYLLIGSYLLMTADATIPTALIQDSIKGLKNTISKIKKKEKTQKQQLKQEKRKEKKQDKQLKNEQKKQEKLERKEAKKQEKLDRKEAKKQEKLDRKEAKENYKRHVRNIDTNPTEKTDLEKEVEEFKEKLNKEHSNVNTKDVEERVEEAEILEDLSELNSENTIDADKEYESNSKDDKIVEILESQKQLDAQSQSKNNNKEFLP